MSSPPPLGSGGMIFVSSARQGGQLLNFRSQGGDTFRGEDDFRQSSRGELLYHGDPGVGKLRGGEDFFSFKQGGELTLDDTMETEIQTIYLSTYSNEHHQSFFLISDFLAESLKVNKN